MSTNNLNTQIDELVRKVDSKFSGYNNSTATMVILDSKGQAYGSKPSGLKRFNSFTYYLVDTTKSVTYNDYLCTLTGKNGLINILIDIKIRCQSRDAVKAAVSKASGKGALNNLLAFLQEEVENYHHSNSLIDDFYAKKTALEIFISDKLKNEGLTVFSISIQLDGNKEALAGIHIEINMFKVALSGIEPKAVLRLNADISTIQGQEAKALAKKINNDVVEDALLTITRDHVADGMTAEDLFKYYNTRLREHVEGKMNLFLKDYGKQVRYLSFVLLKPGSLNVIVVDSGGYVDVRIKNSHQPVQLKYSCELVADPDRQARARLFPANTVELEEVIKDQIRNTLATEVNAQEFADELNTTVSSKLARAINSRIESWGRIAGIFQLEAESSKIPRFLQVVHELDCVTQDGHAVIVKNTLLLQRTYSVQKVFEATQIDFDGWARSELDRITKNFIIKRTYNQLLFAFDDAELKAQMEAEAEKIGYTVNQLVTIPEFDGKSRPELFKLIYKDYNLKSKVDGVILAISVSIEGKIIDYSKIIGKLEPKEQVTDNMEKAIDNKMRQLFHGVDPDRFYVRFYYTDEEKGDRKTLEQEIKDMIAQLLMDEYGSAVRDVTVNRLNTKLIERFNQLQEGELFCDFSDKTAHFQYRARVFIKSVDPERWYVFNSRGYKPCREDADDLERKAIVQHIREYLENHINSSLLPYYQRKEIQDNEDWIDMLKDKYSSVILEIKEYFGLMVEILTPVRVWLETPINKIVINAIIDDKKNQTVIANEIRKVSAEERLARLRFLHAERTRKEQQEGFSVNAPEMRKINDEIKELVREASIFDSFNLQNSFQPRLTNGNSNSEPDGK